MDHMEVYEISRRNLKINDVSIGLLHDLFFKSFLRFTEFTEWKESFAGIFKTCCIWMLDCPWLDPLPTENGYVDD